MSKKCALPGIVYVVSEEYNDERLSKLQTAMLSQHLFLSWFVSGDYQSRLDMNNVRRIMDDSQCVLYLMSRDSIRSTLNYAELSYASNEGKPIFALVVDDVQNEIDLDECDFDEIEIASGDLTIDNPAVRNIIHAIKRELGLPDMLDGQSDNDSDKKVEFSPVGVSEYPYHEQNVEDLPSFLIKKIEQEGDGQIEEEGDGQAEKSDLDKAVDEFLSGTEEVELVTYDLDGDNTELEKKLSEYFTALDSAMAEEGLGRKLEQAEEQDYKAPPESLLGKTFDKIKPDEAWQTVMLGLIERAFEDNGLKAEFDYAFTGNQVTRFVFAMPEPFREKKLGAVAERITIASKMFRGKAMITLLERNPNYVGVDVANPKEQYFSIREAITSREFRQSRKPLTVPLGKDVYGDVVMADIEKMPHLLIGGTTGIGKTELLHSIILSLIYKNSPDDLRLLLVDPKRVDFNVCNGLPHVLGQRVLTTPNEALAAFKWLRKEMERRYNILMEQRLCSVTEYREKRKDDPSLAPLPYIVMIIDEFADLMVTYKNDVQTELCSIAGKAKAAGIHIIMATQRSTGDVVTGMVKSNMPTVVAMKVMAPNNSHVLVDTTGAENLFGNGDMLVSFQNSDGLERMQAPYVDVLDLIDCTDYVKKHNEAPFDTEFNEDFDEILRDSNRDKERSSRTDGNKMGKNDPLFKTVIRFFYHSGTASGAVLLRKFNIGYRRACSLMDAAEELGFISKLSEKSPRAVFVTPKTFKDYFGEDIGDED